MGVVDIRFRFVTVAIVAFLLTVLGACSTSYKSAGNLAVGDCYLATDIGLSYTASVDVIDPDTLEPGQMASCVTHVIQTESFDEIDAAADRCEFQAVVPGSREVYEEEGGVVLCLEVEIGTSG